MRRLIGVVGGVAATAAVVAMGASSSPTALSKKIVLQSRINGNDEIVTVSITGAGRDRLTYHPATDTNPTWSADGKYIAFESDRNGEPYYDHDVFVMRSDGRNIRQLTFSNADDGDPAWGWLNRIAFESGRTGNVDVWSIKPDGKDERQLTTSKSFDGDPAWSPDGERIVFTSARDDGDYEIYVMNADGTGQKRLTRSSGIDENPSWSPDGKRIAFDSNRDGNLEVYVMNADGSNVKRLTEHPALDALPSWSQDSRRIVFVSDRRGKNRRAIFSMRADGTGVKRLTFGSFDMSPDWARG
jgi:Tol biopolymer transport system component